MIINYNLYLCFNIFLKRKYLKVGRCFFIFIISDFSSGESNERFLFLSIYRRSFISKTLGIVELFKFMGVILVDCIIFYGRLECDYLYVDLVEGMKNKDFFIIFGGIFN